MNYMLNSMGRRANAILFAALVGTFTGPALATGVQPETSVVVLDLDEGEVSLNVKNTETVPTLLYTSLQDIPEDKEALVVVTPPVARVEPGDTQLVRFISQVKEPLKSERLKRVVFEGIPQRESPSGAKLSVTVRQNLPVIIHPAGLAKNGEPWKLLKWSVQGGQLNVSNDSPYVVRLAQEATLQPSGATAELVRTYVLPGETLKASIKGKADGATMVRISPATVYGYSVEHYDAPLSTH